MASLSVPAKGFEVDGANASTSSIPSMDGQTMPEGGGGGNKGFAQLMRGLVADIDDYAKDKPDFETTGTKFLVHLSSMYLGLRGMAEYMIEAAANPYFAALGVSTEDGGDFTSRMWLPFSMKPMYALLSDLLPILNYKKRWYFVLYAALGTCGALALGTLPYSALSGGFDQDPKTGEDLDTVKGTPAFYMFFLTIIAISACDMLNQGKYSEVCAAKGSTIVSFVYAAKTCAGLVGFAVAGFLNDGAGPRTVCFIAMFFFAQFIPVCIMNFVGDTKMDTYCKPDTSLLTKFPKLFALAFSIFLVALISSTWSIWASLMGLDSDTSRYVRIGFLIVACLGLLVCSFFALPREIAKINVYLWLCRAMTLNFSYALQGFYTAPSAVCPAGPNFPNAVYQSMGNTCAALATLFGIWLFENYVVHWNAPKAFWVTTAFTCVGALFDINMVTGTNRRLLAFTGLGEVTWQGNIPFVFGGWDGDAIRMDDLVSFLFGTQALRAVVDTLDNLPSTLLLSKLCPKGLETTVFSVLVAFFNLGGSLAGQMGARFLAYFAVNIKSQKNCDAGALPPNETVNETDFLRFLSEEDPSNCCNLGSALGGSMSGFTWALVFGDILMPLATIPLTWIFIPHIRLDAEFIKEDEINDFGGNSRTVSALGATETGSRALSALGTESQAPVMDARLSAMGANMSVSQQANAMIAVASSASHPASRNGAFL